MIRRRPVVIANQIRLKRSQHRGAFLVVEGRDDRLFLERFVDISSCRIVVGEDKASVCKIVEILDQDNFSGLAALVDSDFDRVEGRTPGSINIISTDLHDIECMLIRSSAFDAVLVEFGSREKIDRFNIDVREILIAAASPVGALRLKSERDGINLKFDGLNYAQCIGRESLELNRRALVREVKNRSQRPDISDEVLEEAIEVIEAEAHDPWQICAAPDLLGTLSIGLRQALGTNNSTNVSPTHLRRALRLAYGDQDFSSTELKQMLEEWEARNASFGILR